MLSKMIENEHRATPSKCPSRIAPIADGLRRAGADQQIPQHTAAQCGCKPNHHDAKEIKVAADRCECTLRRK